MFYLLRGVMESSIGLSARCPNCLWNDLVMFFAVSTSSYVTTWKIIKVLSNLVFKKAKMVFKIYEIEKLKKVHSK